MHEMSIAVNIVDIAVQTARQAGANTINTVTVEIGALSGVVDEALLFCFDSACRGTAAEGAKLEVVSVPARAFCVNCQFEFAATEIMVTCPECGEYVMNLQGGRELKVKNINVD